ncbi:DUF2199 domain-containing protein [Chryseobacterium sp. JJR-5R]|uniref:DUF2199 domain-containing protein n=1 Tax=Chryseobacterium sp. JJR-5R TaxID=3093923 RepID=UPI002A74C641|nr:DUF2199 domain-containing protein [Chryseobacterium sp. JJR-5R]WPO84563.1 DUF2199 domain-containing protein [Chryseobacterium sp. JJR-5R]
MVYHSPFPYSNLSDKDLENAKLSSDFCVIQYLDEICYFIRAVLVQKVTESCQDLEYGVWVSLSEKSYDEYVENYDNENFEEGYFGWLANYLPDYEFDQTIPADVIVNNKMGRPLIYPHESQDHPFIKDFYSGISGKEAEIRINKVLNK